MDLLLDVNIVVDLCAPRLKWYAAAQNAINQCVNNSGRVWLYTGSVQTLVFNLFKEIKLARPHVSIKAAMQLAQQELAVFSKRTQWLAALASEGDVFDTQDPEDEQLILWTSKEKVPRRHGRNRDSINSVSTHPREAPIPNPSNT